MYFSDNPTDREIKSIWFEDDEGYSVSMKSFGHKVEKIDVEGVLSENGSVPWFRVYFENGWIRDINAKYVKEVEYEKVRE